MRIYLTEGKNWSNAFFYSILYVIISILFIDKEMNYLSLFLDWIIFTPTYMLIASFIAALFPKKYKTYLGITPKKHIEPKSAKIRNKLSPYWNLIAMIKEYDKEKDEELFKYIMKEVKNIDERKDILLELVNSIKD